MRHGCDDVRHPPPPSRHKLVSDWVLLQQIIPGLSADPRLILMTIADQRQLQAPSLQRDPEDWR